MSRILKAPYVNVDKDVVIDNTFSLQQQIIKSNQATQHIPIYDEYTEDEQVVALDENDLTEIEAQKQALIQQATQEANEIIENAKIEAQNQAQHIIQQANNEMEEKKEQAYNEGFEKGYTDGDKKAQDEIASIKKEAEDTLSSIKQEKEEAIKNFEPEIINFVIETTQNILTKSFQFNPEIISLLIKKGLLCIKEIKDLKIYVSEQQYDYVFENQQKILNIDTEKNNIEIVKDTSLKNADCIIETNLGTIKCGVDEQLSSIKEALYYILN